MTRFLPFVLCLGAIHVVGAAEPLEDVTQRVGLNGLSGDAAAWTDFDQDGWCDLYVAGQLWRNEQGKRFRRVVDVSLSGPGIWGDFNNDGWPDLFSWTGGGRLFRNIGGKSFEDVSHMLPKSPIQVSLGATWGDFENDGYLDLVTGGRLFRNPGGHNHWLKVRLVGGGAVNASAMGAQVRIPLGDKTLTRQAEGATGQGNQNDLTLHFGLGAHAGRLPLHIRWPDGTPQEVNVRVDRLTTLRRLRKDHGDDWGGR